MRCSACFACRRSSMQAGTGYFDRVQAFNRHCRDERSGDRRGADRRQGRSLAGTFRAVRSGSLRPHRRAAQDGIVVRGAKAHTSVSTNAERADRAADAGDGRSGSGLRGELRDPDGHARSDAACVGVDSTAPQGSPIEHPIGARHKMMETTTVFEDVFVPWERVFLAGEHEFAGPLALAFVEHHRFTAISYKLPLVDALVGAALLMADLNGISKAGHVRDKLDAAHQLCRDAARLDAVRSPPRRGAGAGISCPIRFT